MAMLSENIPIHCTFTTFRVCWCHLWITACISIFFPIANFSPSPLRMSNFDQSCANLAIWSPQGGGRISIHVFIKRGSSSLSILWHHTSSNLLYVKFWMSHWLWQNEIQLCRSFRMISNIVCFSGKAGLKLFRIVTYIPNSTRNIWHLHYIAF